MTHQKKAHLTGFSHVIDFSNSNGRRVLAMEYIDGVPILKLEDEMAKRGINPVGKVAAAAKQ